MKTVKKLVLKTSNPWLGSLILLTTLLVFAFALLGYFLITVALYHGFEYVALNILNSSELQAKFLSIPATTLIILKILRSNN